MLKLKNGLIRISAPFGEIANEIEISPLLDC